MTKTQEVQAVKPPKGASDARDLWDIVLTPEQERAGRATHDFDMGRCFWCDCRQGGQWSRFACTR